MLALILSVAFVIVPIAEIVIILQASEVIGGWPTVALLIVEMLLGGWIVRREGRRAWRALSEALLRGAMPDRELADAALVLVGGTLLLTPGFLTDVVGFVFVLPPTRPLVRRLLTMYVARRVQVAHTRLGTPFGSRRQGDFDQPDQPATGQGAEHRDEHQVIRGEVVDDDGEKR